MSRAAASAGARQSPVATRTTMMPVQTRAPAAGMIAGISNFDLASPGRLCRMMSAMFIAVNTVRSSRTEAEASSVTVPKRVRGTNRIRIARIAP